MERTLTTTIAMLFIDTVVSINALIRKLVLASTQRSGKMINVVSYALKDVQAPVTEISACSEIAAKFRSTRVLSEDRNGSIPPVSSRELLALPR